VAPKDKRIALRAKTPPAPSPAQSGDTTQKQRLNLARLKKKLADDRAKEDKNRITQLKSRIQQSKQEEKDYGRVRMDELKNAQELANQALRDTSMPSEKDTWDETMVGFAKAGQLNAAKATANATQKRQQEANRANVKAAEKSIHGKSFSQVRDDLATTLNWLFRPTDSKLEYRKPSQREEGGYQDGGGVGGSDMVRIKMRRDARNSAHELGDWYSTNNAVVSKVINDMPKTIKGLSSYPIKDVDTLADWMARGIVSGKIPFYRVDDNGNPLMEPNEHITNDTVDKYVAIGESEVLRGIIDKIELAIKHASNTLSAETDKIFARQTIDATGEDITYADSQQLSNMIPVPMEAMVDNALSSGMGLERSATFGQVVQIATRKSEDMAKRYIAKYRLNKEQSERAMAMARLGAHTFVYLSYATMDGVISKQGQNAMGRAFASAINKSLRVEDYFQYKNTLKAFRKMVKGAGSKKATLQDRAAKGILSSLKQRFPKRTTLAQRDLLEKLYLLGANIIVEDKHGLRYIGTLLSADDMRPTIDALKKRKSSVDKSSPSFGVTFVDDGSIIVDAGAIRRAASDGDSSGTQLRMPLNHSTVDEFIAGTWRHESAIHRGLPLALGDAKFKAMLSRIYNTMTPSERKFVIDTWRDAGITLESNEDVAEEYLSLRAEGNKMGSAISSWERVKNIIRAALRLVMPRLSFSDAEINAMVRRGLEASQAAADSTIFNTEELKKNKIAEGSHRYFDNINSRKVKASAAPKRNLANPYADTSLRSEAVEADTLLGTLERESSVERRAKNDALVGEIMTDPKRYKDFLSRVLSSDRALIEDSGLLAAFMRYRETEAGKGRLAELTASGDEGAIAWLLYAAYRKAGTELSREMNARRDQLLGPKERIALELGKAESTAFPEMKAALDAIWAKYKTGKINLNELISSVSKGLSGGIYAGKPGITDVVLPGIDTMWPALIGRINKSKKLRKLNDKNVMQLMTMTSREDVINELTRRLQLYIESQRKHQAAIGTDKQNEAFLAKEQARQYYETAMHAVGDAMTSLGAGWDHKMSAWFRGAILTGLGTWGLFSANMLSNTALAARYIAIDRMGGDILGALARVGVGDLQGAKRNLKALKAALRVLVSMRGPDGSIATAIRWSGNTWNSQRSRREHDSDALLTRGSPLHGMARDVQVGQRILSTEDSLARGILVPMEIAARAVEKGIDPTEALQSAERYPDLWEKAHEVIDEFLLQQKPDKVLRGLIGIRNMAEKGRSSKVPLIEHSSKAVNLILNMAMPIITTPYNSAKMAVKMLPGVSLMKSLLDLVWAHHAEDADVSSDLRARAKKEAAIGAASVVAGIALWSIMGDDGDDDKFIITGSNMDKWTASGRKARRIPPMHIYVNGLLIPYAKFDPFATILSSIANAKELSSRIDKGQEAGRSFEQGVRAIRNNFLDKTTLKLMQEIFALADSRSSPAQWVGGMGSTMLGGYVPNIIRQPMEALRNEVVKKDFSSMDTALRSTMETIAPTLMESLGYGKPMGNRDIFGKPVLKPASTIARGFAPGISPFLRDVSKGNVVDVAITNWNEAHPNEPVELAPARRGQFKLNGKKHLPTVKAWDAYTKARGELFVRIMANTPINYKTPSKQDIQRIRTAWRDAGEQAKYKVFRSR
jgi:hypothetical protein